MPAADLQEAAQTAYDNMVTQWVGNQLRDTVRDFTTAVAAAFPSNNGDNSENERTVSNWIVIGQQVIVSLSADPLNIGLAKFNDAVQYVYRLCWAAFSARNPPTGFPTRITAAQATAILTSYNLQFP